MYSQEMVFVTPQSATGLLSKTPDTQVTKWVDYNADEMFDVGVKIISWGVSKELSPGTVPYIFSVDGTVTKDRKLWDNTERVGKRFYERIKGTKNRMFHSERPESGRFEVHNNYLKGTLEYYKKPLLYQKKKVAISSSRAFKEEHFIISTDDFGCMYAILDLSDVTDTQYENLIKFLFSPLNIIIQEKYKLLYNTGFNNTLFYLPKFDLDSGVFNDTRVKEVWGLSPEELKWLSV